MKFIYFLKDNPNYPQILMGQSKAEIKSILLESLSSEDEILQIFTEDEFNRISNKNKPSVQGIYNDSDSYSNSKDFFNDVLKSAENMTNEMNQAQVSGPKEVEVQEVVQEQPKQEIQNVQTTETKFFELNGEKLKLENNKLFKLNWTELSESEIEKFRIISTKTKKELKSDQYKIEKLDWIEIQNNMF